MQGLWGRVKAELVESIGQLQQDQYFCVIVYGAGSVLESGGGKMVRASTQAKKEASGFINSLNPAGATNAMAAIQQAVKIRDQRGDPPSVIYFLTDGFELSEQDGSRFANQVATMLRSFSPKTQINTIGLWPDETDKRTLETIARESGGQFTLIGNMSENQ
jgi:Mg-chelatase subunit ChlD